MGRGFARHADLLTVTDAGGRPSATRPSITLCMMVRDESRTIERCLRSVRDRIDRWVIVDTGSTDATPQLVERLLRDVPGQLHHRAWRDFGTNRTELVRLAAGCPGYLLVLDADHTVEGPEIGSLGDEVYALRDLDDPEMWTPRLLHGDRAWRFEGRTHERLVGAAPFAVTPLEGVVVRHHGDGANRDGRLARDQWALEHQLVRAPTDARTTFFLAQTYRDLGKTAAAVDLYRRSTELGGLDADTAFAAAYQAAAVSAQLDPRVGIPQLVDVWHLHPDRVEPLYDAALAARVGGDHELALWITEQARGIAPPAHRSFVHRWMYDWGIGLERAAALGNLGRATEGAAIVDDLLDTPGLPPWLDVDLILLRQWLEDVHVRSTGAVPWSVALRPTPAHPAGLPVVERPSLLEHLIGPVPSVLLAGEVEPPWAALNPSVAGTDEGFGVLIRLTNWRYTDDAPGAMVPWARYVVQGGDQFIRNRAQLRFHATDGSVTSIIDVKEPYDRPRLPIRIRGLEDCRLFWWRGAWHAIACVVDTTPDEVYQLALVRIDGDRFTDFQPLLGPERGRSEKNWMPFVVGDRLLLVYGCHPFTVLEWDPEFLELREVQRVRTPASMAELRGGSQGLPVDGGFLFLVHERRASKTNMLYVHRLLKISDDLVPEAMSPAFVFQRYGIEFGAGLAAWGDSLLMSYGVQDRTAWLAAAGKAELLALLEPIPPAPPVGSPEPGGLDSPSLREPRLGRAAVGEVLWRPPSGPI